MFYSISACSQQLSRKGNQVDTPKSLFSRVTMTNYTNHHQTQERVGHFICDFSWNVLQPCIYTPQGVCHLGTCTTGRFGRLPSTWFFFVAHWSHFLVLVATARCMFANLCTSCMLLFCEIHLSKLLWGQSHVYCCKRSCDDACVETTHVGVQSRQKACANPIMQKAHTTKLTTLASLAACVSTSTWWSWRFYKSLASRSTGRPICMKTSRCASKSTAYDMQRAL